MAGECPECGNLVSAAAASCRQCGADLGERPPVAAPRPKQMDDAVKYAVIVGVLLAGALVLYMLTSGMGMTSPCVDCKGKGVTICANCKDGKPRCMVCKGSRLDPQNFSTCQACAGKGELATCPKCKGEPKKRCVSCNGTGSIAK